MSIKKMKQEELESLSYKDLTYLLLEEKKKKMNTADIFKEIVKILNLSEATFNNKIGDFYTSLTTDKRFVLLEDGKWDLRSRHTSDKIMKTNIDEDDELDEIKTEEIDNVKEDEDNYDDVDDDEDYEETDDELKDLVVIDEDELELEQ